MAVVKCCNSLSTVCSILSTALASGTISPNFALCCIYHTTENKGDPSHRVVLLSGPSCGKLILGHPGSLVDKYLLSSYCMKRGICYCRLFLWSPELTSGRFACLRSCRIGLIGYLARWHKRPLNQALVSLRYV